jgi:hypothetical protein
MTAPEEMMPCMGSEPSYFKVGNDLLVYAKGSARTSQYFMASCSRTAMAQNAKDDISELGRGEEPARQIQSSR